MFEVSTLLRNKGQHWTRVRSVTSELALTSHGEMEAYRQYIRVDVKRRWLDRESDDIKEKGLSADDVYDGATWRRMSSYIDPI